MRPKPNDHVAAGVAGLRTVMVNVYFVASATDPADRIAKAFV